MISPIRRPRFNERGRVIEADGSLGRWETDDELAVHLRDLVIPDQTIWKPTESDHSVVAAIEGMARAVRERYECGATGMECGGNCHRPIGHEPPCYCLGIDEDGEETCPA